MQENKNQTEELDINHLMQIRREKVDDEGYYIVYSWGDGPDLLEELDFRGH